MDTKHITLDVSKAPTSNRIIRVGEKDKDGTTLVVDVLDHGESLALDDYDVSLLIKFSDTDMYEIAGSTSGNQATFTINAENMQAGWTDRACVQLSDDDFTLSTGRFVLQVLKSAGVA